MSWGIAENPDGTRQAGGPFEIQVERVRAQSGEYKGFGLRVRYRVKGTRLFTKFVLLPDPGDWDCGQLQRKVVLAVEAHHAMREKSKVPA